MIGATNVMPLDADNTLNQTSEPPSFGKFVNPSRHQTIDRSIKYSSDCNNSSFTANSQNPTFCHTIKRLPPPPAHSEVSDVALDLSVKSKSFQTPLYISEKQTSTDNCVAIDLSVKRQTNILHSNNQKINSQSNDVEIQFSGGVAAATNETDMEIEESDDSFITRLIESSEFNSKNPTEHDGGLQDDSILGINESLRAALDMPLLDNDANSQKNGKLLDVIFLVK